MLFRLLVPFGPSRQRTVGELFLNRRRSVTQEQTIYHEGTAMGVHSGHSNIGRGLLLAIERYHDDG